jgi:hypothetical protein
MIRAIAANSLLGLLVLGASCSGAKADCNPKDFMVQDVTSIQQSGATELAFVLTATQSDYENAKKNIAGSGAYGLFSGALNYGEAQEKARQIAQSTKFDFKSSYASNYLSQSLSGRAQHVRCPDQRAPWRAGRE